MGTKMMLLVGLGAGYVLGTRSGRERYDQLVGGVQQVLHKKERPGPTEPSTP